MPIELVMHPARSQANGWSWHTMLAVMAVGVVFSGTSRLNGQTTLTYDTSGYLRSVAPAANTAPSIIAQPHSVVAPTGTVATLSVSAIGSPPLTYQWQLNSNNITGSADTLVRTNLAPADFGAYRVIVGNAFGSVTSSNALLQLDSDRDGMADSWEITYFTSITNRPGYQDFDLDGVSDRDEFREGTDPKNFNSVNPRLTIISDRGEVFVAPNVPLFTNGQTVTLTGVPDPGLQFLAYLGQPGSGGPFYSIRTNPAPLRFGAPGVTGSQIVRAIFGLSLTNSLGVTNGWRIDQAGWYGQTNVTHDGVAAAQSARLLGAAQAVLELTNVVLASEGTITFWWKVDGNDVALLQFRRNNLLRTGAIGTNTDWQLRTYYLPAGTNVVRWEYQGGDRISEYNGLYYAPADAGWVDQVSYAVWPNPLLDSDVNGMPDIWELRYFDRIGLVANADNDGDGISNKDEYLDGTDPNSNGSLLPRLTILASGGTVVRNPDLPKYTLSQTVQLQAVPDPANYFVIWTGAVSGTNTTNSIFMNGNKTITAVFGLPLGGALEAPSLAWSRGGAIGFFGQTNFSRDGADAAQSGPVGFRQESWMETSVNGPGTLIFWWKTSSQTNQSFARFLVDGAEQAGKISGETGWQPQSFLIPSGVHSLRWAYSNNTATVSITNGAWVDQVSLTPGTVAPQIVTQPSDLLVLQGSNAVFTVAAIGTPPFGYQWFRNGVSLGAASTTAILTLSNVALAQQGGYSVQVSNPVQTVPSSSATLTVLPIPPANNNFASRTPLTNAYAVLGYLHGATKESGETNHASTFGTRSVWWSWTAPSNGNYQLVAIGTNVEPSLVAAVYTGNSVEALTEVKSGLGTAISANGTDFSQVAFTFAAAGGTTYAVVVDHSLSAGCFFSLRVQPALPPLLGNVVANPGGPFSFAFSAPPGASYVIETSDDLQLWLPIGGGIVPPSGVVSYSEPASGGFLRRFYRVQLQ